jgi:hypothetical protein
MRHWPCLHELNSNKDLVLRPADKGSNTVLLSRKQYDDECLRQLVGSIHYEEINEPNTKEIHKLVLDTVWEMNESGNLDEMTFKFLYNPEHKPRMPKFYTLPKIHKIKEHLIGLDPLNPTLDPTIRIPGRPIVAQCGGPTEKAGRFLDYFLVPIVKSEPMYLLDSKELLGILETEQFPEDILILTYDVTSMYSNMPHDELIHSTRQALELHRNKTLTDLVLPPTDSLIKLLEILLTRTEFEYSGRFFRQIIGASMGAVPSPEVCDIRMFLLLKEILDNFEFRDLICLHKKYRDDGLIIFSGTQEQASLFCRIANNAHPLLKFEFSISNENCTFLDLDLWKGDRFKQTGKLDTKTHIKETECFAYLHRSSAHPTPCFKGLIKGELGRYIRNSSSKEDFLAQAEHFKNKLLTRGYKESEFDGCMATLNYEERMHKIQKVRQKIKNRAPPLVASTRYHPNSLKIKEIIQKHWPIIQQNEIGRRLFPLAPIVAYSRGKNLSEMLRMRK